MGWGLLPCFYYAVANILVLEIAGEDQEQGSEAPQKKKLVITEEEFQKITHALVMRLRQHEEEVMQDGIIKAFVIVLLLSCLN